MFHRILGPVSHQRRQGWKRYGVGAGLTLVLAVAISLATGWGSAVADQIGKVFITNDSAHPVPVQEQRADANGNIKVHEQGTADVNVTNSSLNVSQPPPITNGGRGFIVPTDSQFHGFGVATATALNIHMTSDVDEVIFNLTQTDSGLGLNVHPAFFYGPAEGASADVSLALDRPIKFDQIGCSGDGSGRCVVSWVGAFSP